MKEEASFAVLGRIAVADETLALFLQRSDCSSGASRDRAIASTSLSHGLGAANCMAVLGSASFNEWHEGAHGESAWRLNSLRSIIWTMHRNALIVAPSRDDSLATDSSHPPDVIPTKAGIQGSTAT